MSRVRLTGTITIPVAEQAVMRPLLDAHIALSRAEPGCLRFDISQDPDDAAVFRLDELFEDEDAFAHHQTRTKASEWGRRSAHLVRAFTRTSA